MVTDPTFERTAIPFFMWWEDGRSRLKRAWQDNIHWPEALVYRGLDPDGVYTLRMTGDGPLIVHVDGERAEPLGDTEEIGRFRLYDVPDEMLNDGVLRVTFGDPDKGNIHWRTYSRVNEVWLLKQGEHE